jgi:hypothetical protein
MKLSSQLFKLSEVFIDGFTGGLNYFPFEGSYFQALLLIKKQQQGASAMRFDVPNVGDPLGAWVLFFVQKQRVTYPVDALTFWAKGTQAGLINEIGFGQDFLENKYLVDKPAVN